MLDLNLNKSISHELIYFYNHFVAEMQTMEAIFPEDYFSVLHEYDAKEEEFYKTIFSGLFYYLD